MLSQFFGFYEWNNRFENKLILENDYQYFGVVMWFFVNYSLAPSHYTSPFFFICLKLLVPSTLDLILGLKMVSFVIEVINNVKQINSLVYYPLYKLKKYEIEFLISIWSQLGSRPKDITQIVHWIYWVPSHFCANLNTWKQQDSCIQSLFLSKSLLLPILCRTLYLMSNSSISYGIFVNVHFNWHQ